MKERMAEVSMGYNVGTDHTKGRGDKRHIKMKEGFRRKCSEENRAADFRGEQHSNKEEFALIDYFVGRLLDEGKLRIG